MSISNVTAQSLASDGVRISIATPKHPDAFVLVDVEDAEAISGHKWHLHQSPRAQTSYARRRVKVDGKQRWVWLHRQILQVDDRATHVDHINGDGLDNRRINLRVCSASQNNANQVRFCALGSTSQFRGVSWNKNANKWVARIGVQGSILHLGVFDSEVEAARAYDKAAIDHFGSFSWLNSERFGI